ncbi:gliding motility-associated C-terminal domain-containing protein [Maribacter sp. SA7]|uniref:Ig-like domain-containing protein n=1 Tax=Maribacter zhoushanensis TaxID=3030012 RepID=UPI0023EAF237|nr:gliding motility-associated C-terminal domain-containing protein [Maribacter zhoushanensis]MDF4201878.1 gliding motility-associated C-terminal domain-containing protein [Maribacter zhoushanensis]
MMSKLTKLLFSLFLLIGLTSFSTDIEIKSNSHLTHTSVVETYGDALDVPPTFSNCPPSDVVVTYTVDECGAVVTWTPPTASADAVSVTSNYSPGDSFLPGTTAVIYRAEDSAGNVTVCTFNVTVEDDQDPIFDTFPTDVTLTADPDTCTVAHTWAEPTASDNCPAGEGEAPVLQDFENAINQCYTFVRSSIEGGGVINGTRNLVSTGISSGTFFASSMTTPVFYFNGFGEITFSHSISAVSNSPSIHLDVLDENGVTITSSYFSKTYTTTGVQQEIIPFNLVGNYQIKIRYSSTSLFNSGMEAYLDDLLIPGTIVTNINDTSCEIADYVIFRTDGTGLNSGDQFDIGTTTIRYTVRDASGNFVERSFNITVENDVSPPSGTTEYMYCEGDTPPEMSVTVDVAGGETANWYDEYGMLVATGVTSYTAPATGEFYRNYLVYSQNANGCTSENFLSIDLYQIPKPPTPVADNPIEYCVGDTPVALTATALSNHTLQWYTAATGGTAASTAPTPTTTSAGTTSYYVSQTDDSTSCESDRTQIDVIVYAIPTAPVVNSPVDYCIGDTAAQLDSHATGTNLRWYDAATGGNEIPGTTTPDTSTVGQQSFWVTQSTVNGSANCEGPRRRLRINVYDAPVITTQPTNEAVCEGGTVTFDVAASGSGTIQWQLFDGSSWNDLTNTAPHGGVTTNTLTVTNVTLAMSGNRYRAIASSPAASCSDATSDEAILTVNTSPPVPTSGGDITECEQDPIQTLTATATPPSGASIIWYDALTGGNVVASPTLNAVGTITYYAESNDTVNGCPSVGRTAVTLTIQPAPVAPTSGGDITECEQDPIQTLTATATAPTGSTLVWYDAASGGNVVASPEWNSVGTEIYYAESQDDVTGCPSVTRTAVSLTIQPAPAAPTSGGDVTECEQNPIQTLTATATVPSGFTMTWYDAATGGNLVASPEWSAVGSVTYYAESQNNTSACISLSRTPVTLTIDAIPDAPISGGDQIECEANPTQTMTATATAPTGSTVVWYAAATGGSAIGSPTLNAVGTVTYYAESRTTSSGCISETRTAVTLTMNSNPTIAITPSSQTCSADLATYSVSVDVDRGTVTSTEGTVTDNGGNNWTIAGITSGNNITVTVTDGNSCAESISINAPNCACPTVNAPTSGGDQTVCEQDPIQTLTATATAPAGASVVWYDAASGGTMVASPTWNTVGSTTYYAESVDDVNGCTSTTRTAVNLTIQAAPAAPISGGDQAECETAPIQTLTATATCAAGNSIVWYDAATGGNVVATPEWSSVGTMTFYAESQDDATSCVSHSRTAVSLTIEPNPTAPISGGNQTECETSPIQTLTATATAPSGSTVIWYDAASNGSVITNPILDAVGTITYYAESEHTTTSCVSTSRTAVMLTIQDSPDITIATAATCAPDLLTYSVSVDVSEGTVTTTEGTVVDNGGNNWTISNITSGNDITLTVTAPNSCTQTLDVTAPDCACPVVDAPISGGDQTECEENPIQTLTATATPPAGATVVWYDAATGGNVVADPSLSATGTVTYYAESRDNVTNCVSGTRTEVVLTINATPTAPVSGGDITECETSPTQTLTATATAPAGSSIVWYDAATGGNVVASPILDTVGSVTYYAESEDNTSACPSFTRTAVNLTIQDTPDITIATAATCAPDLLTYSVSVDVSEGTVTSTEGTVVDNGGNNWTISNITSGNDITLTVTAPNSCAQTLDITAPDCACPVVDAPISGGNQTECEQNPIQTLTATATPPAGATVIWYDAATGGNVVADPSLSATGSTTYYAESRDNVTNCVSGTRTEVVLTINETPTAPISGGDITECETSPIQTLTATATAPAGSSVVWYDAATGGNVVASPILDAVGSVTYYAESESDTSACPSFTRTAVNLTIQDTPDITIATAATCAPDLLTYSVSVDVSEGTVTSTEGTVVDNGGNNWTISNISSGNDITLTVTAPNSCAQTLDITAPDCACPVVDAPISGGDQTECEENPIQTLTATATPPAGATVIWYDAVTGGTIVADPSLSATGSTTYYAESRDNVTNCVSSTRTAVILTIEAAPTAPTSGGDQVVCEQNPIQTLTATATAPVGSNVVWYDAATGGNVVASPILNAVGNITYYAESDNATSSCISLTRTAVSLTIEAAPTAPISGGDITECEASPIQTLTATATAPAGSSIIWYDAASGGNVITNPILDAVGSVTYYAESENTTSSCVSLSRTAVNLTIQDTPDITIATAATCAPDLLTYSVSVDVSEGTVTSTEGTVVDNGGNNWTISGITSGNNITLTVTAPNTCIQTMAVTAPDCACPVVDAPISGGNQTECEQNPIQTLTATATPPADATVVWYDAAIGGSIVTDPSLNTVGTISYFAESVQNVTNCISNTRTEVVLTIEETPPAPTSGGDQAECEQNPIQTLTATVSIPTGYSVVWYDAATGGNVVTDPTLNAVGSTTYYAEKVDDASSCTSFSRTPVDLTIYALPTVVANASVTTINAGEPVTLNGSGATSYIWDNGVTDGDTVYPLVTTTYTVVGTDGNTCENTDSVTITVNATSDIEIAHSVDNANPNVGDLVTFTLTATNNGPSDDTGGTIINSLLPAGYTYVSDTGSTANGIYDSATGNWTLPSLSNGASLTVEITATVNPPTGAVNEYLNIAQVTSATNYDADSVPNNDDGDQSEDDEAAASIVPQVADLEVTNTISQPSANPGDALTITVDVLNNGPDDVTNVSIENVVPVGFTVTGINNGGMQSGNTITWSGLTISNGTTETLTFNVDVNDPVNTPDEYLNTVQVVTVDQYDPDSTPNNDDGDQSEDDEDNVELRLQSTDLEIINTVAPATGNPGDVLTFTVEVVNNGTDDATNVVVSNIVPTGFTVLTINDGGSQTDDEILWTVLSVPNGTTTTLTFEASINVPTNSTDEYVNTVQIVNVDQLDPDSTPNNDDGDQSEDDEDNAEIVLIPADLSLGIALSSASNPAPNSGDTVTFELTLTNDGPGIATNVSIENTLPVGYTLGTVNDGGSVSGNVISWNFSSVPVGTQVVTYEVTLNAPNNVADEYTTIAQVIASDQFDPDSNPNNDDGNQSEDDEDSHMINAPTVDLEIAKMVDKEETFFEDTIVFTVTVTNNSTYEATNIGVEDVLPSGYEFVSATATDGAYSETTSTWDIPSIAIGATASLEMTVYVTDIDDYTNVAELIYVDQVDLNIDNDRAEVTPVVTQAQCFTVFNKFTPNNDGLNDVFFIECIENYPNNNVKVFNRWGNQVFEMDNYDNTWDGTSMGRATISAPEKLPVGTYFYLIDFGDGSEPKTGWLYITR